jgi:nucleotide-binding universal stress UspA family protein
VVIILNSSKTIGFFANGITFVFISFFLSQKRNCKGKLFVEYNIIIPFDFSEQSQNVLKTAAELCDRMDAEIHVIHVVEADCAEEEKQKLLNRLKAICQPYIPACAIKISIEYGRVGSKVLEYAGQQSNAVIFISHGEGSGYTVNYTGPNAHYIIANSSFPVLLLKTSLEYKKISTVLVPIDILIENKLKLSYALFLSRFFDNAVIRLLSVVYDYDDFRLNKLMQVMNRLVAFIEKTGVSCMGEIIRCSEEDGEMYSKVAVEYAERSEAELILLMTNEEKSKPGCGISQDADYMFSHFKNNILSVTPFVALR